MSRLWSNKELRKYSYLFEGDVLNVSAGQNIDKEGNHYDSYFYNAKSFHITNYGKGTYKGFTGLKDELEIDLEKELKYSEIADVIFNHTVLEHVFNIHKAFENLCKLTKDIVILVTPFIQCQHETHDYKDYWRMTPTCINKLFSINGLTIVYQSEGDNKPGTYIFSIASKFPEKWIKHFPEFKPMTKAGAHIP